VSSITNRPIHRRKDPPHPINTDIRHFNGIGILPKTNCVRKSALPTNERPMRPRTRKTSHASCATHQFWPVLTRQRRGTCGPPHAGSPNGPLTRPKRGVKPAHRPTAPGISARSRDPARQNVGKNHGARPVGVHAARTCTRTQRDGPKPKRGVKLVSDRGGAEREIQPHLPPKTSKRRQKNS
jgi:hypothetical protein